MAEEEAKKSIWNKNIGGKNSCTGCGCLIVVVIILAVLVLTALGNARDKANQAENDAPPITTNTPAPEADSGEPSENTNNYPTEVLRISTQTGQAMQEFSEILTGDPTLWTEEDALTLAASTFVIENAYNEAQRLNPPPEFTQVHEVWTSGLKKLAEAMPVFREGVVESDVAKIEQAAGLISEANELINESAAQLEEVAANSAQ